MMDKAAKSAIKGGDQDAINEAYENLTAAYDAYNAKLKELGVQDGDTVLIFNYEFEFYN